MKFKVGNRVSYRGVPGIDKVPGVGVIREIASSGWIYVKTEAPHGKNGFTDWIFCECDLQHRGVVAAKNRSRVDAGPRTL